MKTTHHWLREYCPHGLSPGDAAHRLTMAGVAIEGVRRLGDDVVFEAEVTANRADLQSVIGIARELAALTGTPLRLPPADLAESGAPAPECAHVQVLDSLLCRRYTARILRKVKVGPSPTWLVNRLESIGVRPVNNVVDITNFVLFETGQPLHAFDLVRLAERTVVVRRARPAESIVTIDGAKRALSPEMLVIADAHRPVAVAGIMGGLESEISERTTDVLLESAQFEPTQVRRTSRKLGLSSDSSYRFERGVDPVGVEWASRRAAALMQQLAGAEVAPGIVDIWATPWAPTEIMLRASRLERILGVAVPLDRAAEILRALGFDVAPAARGALAVKIPPWRADVSREIDLIEEVARIFGYDNISSKSNQNLVCAPVSKTERITDALRTLLAGCGYFEALTHSFHTASDAALFSPWTDEPALVFNNVIRSEEDRLRVSIVPGLLRAKATNLAHGNPRTRLFELGHVFLSRPGEPLPEERLCLALLEEDGFHALKGVIEEVARSAGVCAPLAISSLDHPLFEPGQGAALRLEGRLLAVLGTLCRPIAEDLGCPAAAPLPAVGEVDLQLVIERADLLRRVAPLPVFPASRRDVAVVVAETTPWAEIEACAREAAGEQLADLTLFDVYRGKQVPPGKKSVAFTLTFRAADRTLTGEEVAAACDAIVAALAARFGASLRA